MKHEFKVGSDGRRSLERNSEALKGLLKLSWLLCLGTFLKIADDTLFKQKLWEISHLFSFCSHL